MVAGRVAGDELDLLAVGDGGVHGALLALWIAAVGALSGNEAHPLVSGGPVLGEIIEELQGIAVLKFLVVDRSVFHGNEVGPCAISFILRAVVSIEHQAAALAGHALVGEREVVLPVCGSGVCGKLAVYIELHFQVIVIAALVLDDQAAIGNAASGKLLTKFPVCGHINLVQFLRRCTQPVGYRLDTLLEFFTGLRRQRSRTSSQEHCERKKACCESSVQIMFHIVWSFLRKYR